MKLELARIQDFIINSYDLPKVNIRYHIGVFRTTEVLPRPNLKFNSGIGALLCGNCRTMYRDRLSRREFEGVVSSIYCDDCKDHQHNPIGR